MKLYAIKDWERYHERAQTRKIKGPLTWVAVPTKRDGKSFRRLMAKKNGAAVFGIWVLLLEIAATCEPRGMLQDEGTPLTSADISFQTGLPERQIDEALEVLSSQDIRWIVVAEWEHDGSTLPLQWEHGGSTLPLEKRREEKRRNNMLAHVSPEVDTASETQHKPSGAEAAVLTFPCSGSAGKPREYRLTQEKIDEYARAFPGVDVLAECRKALQWCIDNPARRKTVQGMPAFLGKWLAKEQNMRGTSRRTAQSHLEKFRESRNERRSV